MLAIVDDQLQNLARAIAATLSRPDKKQLKFNEIIETAKLFYPNDVEGGVVELVSACNRAAGFAGPDFIGPLLPNDTMYTTRKDPMWLTLREQYGWMLDG